MILTSMFFWGGRGNRESNSFLWMDGFGIFLEGREPRTTPHSLSVPPLHPPLAGEEMALKGVSNQTVLPFQTHHLNTRVGIFPTASYYKLPDFLLTPTCLATLGFGKLPPDSAFVVKDWGGGGTSSGFC